jgi:hypothetical protein
MVSHQKTRQMNNITLTAADSISYPEHPEQYFSVPNDRIGTGLRNGEGIMRQHEGKLIELIQQDGDKNGLIREVKALTYDDGKPPLASLPPAGIRAAALVQAYGKAKYGDDENYRKGMEAKRQMSCALRHIYAWLDGEDLDPESKQSHLAHGACRLLFALQNIHDGTLIDDRYSKNKQP